MTTTAVHPSTERECQHFTHALNVLVAEDDSAAAESIARILERAGHTIRVVYDGQAAVAAALIDPPDVVILDINLPRMDGWTAARRIRAGLRGRPCLLVAITGCDEPNNRLHLRRAGMQTHLSKPLAPEVLVALLDRYSAAARRFEAFYRPNRRR